MAAEDTGTVPLALESVLSRLKLSGEPRDARDALEGVRVESELIQDFRPMADSLEWQLADAYWLREGVQPFVDSEVPFIVNNSGRASEDAAAVFVASCVDAGPALPARLSLLELGAGTGLFALHFLNALRGLCEARGHDFYARTTYYVSDRSRRTVEQWLERELYAAHAEHVVVGVCDAQHPESFQPLRSGQPQLAAPRAVFCNYVLDVLPTAIVRRGERGCEQLCVRTHLTTHRALLPQYTPLTLDEVRQRAASPDPNARAELLPILGLLEFESQFLPVSARAPEHVEAALALGDGLSRVPLNYGALAALERCLQLIADDGFVLVNDYGPSSREQLAEQAHAQRFGSSTAVGVNFPLLERHFTQRGCTVAAASGDAERPIHSRLIHTRPLPRANQIFAELYSGAAWLTVNRPAEEARAHAAGGRNDQALESFRQALAHSPRDWHLIGQAAEFVALQLRDFSAGLDLIRAAIELNPCYSTWLWNVLGDCLFCTERFDEAHEAYLQAARLQAADVRTNFNLAYTHANRGAFDRALAAIACALANDAAAAYRERLLDKQRQILAAISAKGLGERERQWKRAVSFAAAPEPTTEAASTSRS